MKKNSDNHFHVHTLNHACLPLPSASACAPVPLPRTGSIPDLPACSPSVLLLVVSTLAEADRGEEEELSA